MTPITGRTFDRTTKSLNIHNFHYSDGRRWLTEGLLVFFSIHIAGRDALRRRYILRDGLSGYVLMCSIWNRLDDFVGSRARGKSLQIVYQMTLGLVVSQENLPNWIDGTPTWKALLTFDSATVHEISKITFDIKDLNVFKIMTELLAIDLSELEGTLRGFYLLTLRQMLYRGQSLQKRLEGVLDKLIDKYQYQDIFKAVPLSIQTLEECMTPITGRMGRLGGKSALNTMIGEYAARSPTRAEVVARLIKGT